MWLGDRKDGNGPKKYLRAEAAWVKKICPLDLNLSLPTIAASGRSGTPDGIPVTYIQFEFGLFKFRLSPPTHGTYVKGMLW